MSHSRKGNRRKRTNAMIAKALREERAKAKEMQQVTAEVRKILQLRVKKRKVKYVPMPAIEYHSGDDNDFSQMGFGRRPRRRTKEEWAIEHNPVVQEHVIDFITELGVLPPEDLALVAAKIRTLGPEPLKETLKAWSPTRYEEAYGSDGIVDTSYMVGGLQELIKILDIQLTQAGEKAVLQFDQENELTEEKEEKEE
jgi:hypothetical protein